ncbi:Fic family protein [Neolewinella lacunae]|uniref:Fic family protein n=1 Tax=Neolewinella lacunae TaxID=1517758 RepID=A0A923PG05_9BACT|nr:Fic family protein [Neolewinella lacunae]MBC6993390.1 Fic family protein [Neolewinella lacunae]MDN3635152.1 Fic family protein [Neolewinella lacunae]
MRSVQNLEITPEILNLIAEIDEFKGAWRALGNLAPEVLVRLQKVATIESIASSTRIEGSKLSDRQVEQLLLNLSVANFNTRDEQEVAGYAELMNTIFQHFADIPLSENFIQQMHGLLLKYSDKDQWHQGQYKQHPNHVVATDAEGQQIGIVFETSSPRETPQKMRELVEWTQQALSDGHFHPLLVVGIFILCFLAIHPFQDGNGRLSRALTTYLLLKVGYRYVPYSSLEAIIEQEKQAYYLSLRRTQSTLGLAETDWHPWLLFFLKSLKRQKDNLEIKVSREHILLTQMPELAQQILEIIQSRGRTTMSELERLTSANRNTLRKNIATLIHNQQLQQNGVGKGTWYSLALE